MSTVKDPELLFALDPGTRSAGCALFKGRVLVRAWLSRPDAKRHLGPGEEVLPRPGPAAWELLARSVRDDLVNALDVEWHRRLPQFPLPLVVEIPQVYQGSKQKGDPNDLIQLAACAGYTVGRLSRELPLEPRGVRPSEWKGQVPKEAHHDRVKGRLGPGELLNVALPSAASLHHNVWDAVALGLWALGRR